MKTHDLAGQTFGRLRALRPSDKRYRKQVVWICSCECGATAEVASYHLTTGKTKSCGCYRVDLGRAHGAQINLRHGEGSNGKESAEYRAWAQMKSRCANSNHSGFRYYGARGITVCERWQAFESFLADMGRRPSDAHSLDRIDNDGHYEPGNCRWATSVEQNRNTRFNRRVEIDGVTRTIAEWCEATGIARHVLSNRLQRGSVGTALLRPVRAYVPKP